MPFPLSPQSINAIAEVISGGWGENSIFVYRTGREIKNFMSALNVPFSVSDSRVASLTDCLIKLNSSPEEAKQKFPKIIESAADHRKFNNDPERHAAVVKYLNEMLYPDNFKLVQVQNARMQLVELGHETVPLITWGNCW